MFRVLIAFLVLSTFTVAAPWAAAGDRTEPPQDHKWWQGQRAKELGLNADQSVRIENIYQATFPRIQAAMTDLEQAQKDLNKLIVADRTTETDVVRQVNQVAIARTEVSRQMTLMLFRFYQELTPDQRHKVQAMFEARRAQDRRGGRRDEPPQRQTKK